MRAVVQRVSSARVTVSGETIGEIGEGLMVLLGVALGDTAADAEWLAEKICALRIFEDEQGRMNHSMRELNSSEDNIKPTTQNPKPARPALLVVSQFTLIASTRKGTRPSFNDAAKPEDAIPLYELFVRHASAVLGSTVITGKFGASMEVALVNDGPVTLIIDSRQRE